MAEHDQLNDIIGRLKQGDDSVLTSLYLTVKPEFQQWSMKQYSLSESDSIELFQMAMVIFYDNVITGKLKELTTSVKTYVFAIAKNKARELFRKRNKTVPLSEMVQQYVDSNSIEEKKDYEVQLDGMRQALNRLGQKCQDMLKLYYYQKMDMSSISELLNYSGASTAKNMKYKCLQQLRKLIQTS